MMVSESRRRFVLGTGSALLLMACTGKGGSERVPAVSGESKGDEDVSPPEDLMREHGVLNRILLLYEECARRLDTKEAVPIEVVATAADLIRRFIEGYHEKNEEDFLFPRFEKANQLVDLVGTLRRQHQAGRVLTETILRLSNRTAIERSNDRGDLIVALRKFTHMYRPHEAREDTVLFPAFRRLMTPKEFDALGEQFEDREHELFGKDGFENIVEQVGGLEKQIGTYELDAFTPA